MKEKLYIKLPNGRYQEYKPVPQYDNALYRKRGNKYVPWAMDLRSNELDEGVWVIVKDKGCTSFSNGKSMYDSYLCMKCGDIVKAPSLAELGGWNKLADYLLQNWDKVDKRCVDTMCKTIVGILMQYGKEDEE